MSNPTHIVRTGKCILKNKNIVSREIHSSYFLIDITDNYAHDKCALYEINETGKFIWDHIDDTRSICDLVAKLQAAIIDEVDYQVLYDDVSEFVDTLIAKNFVEV